MSNTINRPRKRPRVKSSNFRALWWAMHRQAALCIMSPVTAHRRPHPYVSRTARARKSTIERWTRRILEAFPEWRYYR